MVASVWHDLFRILIPESGTVPCIHREKEANQRENLLSDFDVCLAREGLVRILPNVTTGEGAPMTASAQLTALLCAAPVLLSPLELLRNQLHLVGLEFLVDVIVHEVECF